MKEKLAVLENILFLIFLVSVPTAFYIIKYPSCYSLALRRDAFYFYLELAVLFAILFIIFTCFPHHFVRPMLTKNIFFVFGLFFIPWICHYASSTYFYGPYRKVFLYGIVVISTFCFIIPGVSEPKPNAKEKFTVSDTFLYHYAFICPIIIASYLLPLIHTSEIIDDPKFLFLFAIGTSLICYFIYISFTMLRFILPYYNFFKKLAISFLCLFIPYFIYYAASTNQMVKYIFITMFTWFASYGLLKFLVLDFPTNEDGFPLPRPQPPEED